MIRRSIPVAVLLTIASSTVTSQSLLAQEKRLPALPPAMAQPRLGESAEVMLANYLTQIGAKMYGASRCPYSQRQQQLFGADAFPKLTYIECAPGNKNAQLSRCQAAHIQTTPTWEIKGHLYRGVRSLEQLARLSGYRGRSDFHFGGQP